MLPKLFFGFSRVATERASAWHTSINRSLLAIRHSPPHPRPLPATRFARGRRGADRRRTDSNPGARSRGTIPGPPPRLGVHPGLTAGFRKLAHAQDVALPLGDRDHAAGVEQIEGVACLDALVVSRQRHQVVPAVATFFPPGREIFPAGGLR